MTHPPRPLPADPAIGSLVIDTLMLFAREGIKLSGLKVKTKGYLWIAFMLQIDDPREMPRVLPSRISPGASVDWVSAQSSTKPASPVVRVGSSFTITGPSGPFTIEEDKT